MRPTTTPRALRAAEDAAASLAAEQAERAEAERSRREAHDTARAALTALQVRAARLGGEVEAIARDRARLADERAAAASDLELQRRLLARPVPARDVTLDAAVADADRALAEALAELGALRAERQARGEEAAALRRAAAAREAEAETARRRLADAERRAAAEREAREAGSANHARLQAGATEARATPRGVDRRRAGGRRRPERRPVPRRTKRRPPARVLPSVRRPSVRSSRPSAAGWTGWTLRSPRRHRAASPRLPAATAAGASTRSCVIDPPFRAAVEAALDEAARAYLVPKTSVGELSTERGMLVVESAGTRGDGLSPAESRFVEAAIDAGASRLVDAIRRDPVGAATRLLRRVVVVADVPSALSIQPSLPAGWTAVVRDGSAVVGEHAVRLGGGDGTFERQASAERLRADVARLEKDAEAAAKASAAATNHAEAARQRLDEARAAESRASGERRSAEEAERAASRSLEAAVRESGWQGAQADRLASEVARLREEVAALDAIASPAEPTLTPAGEAANVAVTAIASWEARVADLRAARDRVGASQAAQDAARREAEAAGLARRLPPRSTRSGSVARIGRPPRCPRGRPASSPSGRAPPPTLRRRAEGARRRRAR